MSPSDPYQFLEKSSDEEIIKRYQDSKDRRLVAVLFQRKQHLILPICYQILKDKQESEDTLIEIWELLIRELPKHKITFFNAWLLRVTKNYCLRKQEQKNKVKKDFLAYKDQIDEDDFLVEEEAVEYHSGLDEDFKSEQPNIARLLKKINPEQRECIHLFYAKNKTYKQIAEQLSLNVKEVKSRLQNGKRNLKILIQKEYKPFADAQEAK